MIVVNVASDSAPARPQPTYDTERWVMIAITMTVWELGVTDTGTSPVRIFATARARLPTVLEGPVTVTGTVTLAPYENRPDDCVWTRTVTNPNFKMTVYHSGDLSVLVGGDGPEWYYMIQCDEDPPVRSAQVPFFLLLESALLPYRTTEGVRLPTAVYTGYYSGSGCLKRSAQIQGSSVNADVEVDVWVYQPDYPGGCLLPLLP